ncbi:MAG: hypothetical protein IKY85_01430 [Bacteroidaceae bacterium]|nr:hypothetical protein [Bacteroidaceae bacterium]
MRKMLLGMLFVLLFSVQAFSAADNGIVVKTVFGISSSSFAEIKCIRFEDGIMVLDMKDGSTKSYDTDNISLMTFGYVDGDGTTSILPFGIVASCRIEGSNLIINASSYQSVLLFTSDGKIVYGTSCCGECVIDMSRFAKGVYVLNVNGQVYKIVNR